MTGRRLLVDERYCGPPGAANGGYLAGLLARELRGAVEVRLRAPAPLGKLLELRARPEGLALLDGETELATAAPTTLSLEVPEPPSFADACRVAGSCRALRTHPFPRCFVCGPERREGDGLGIFPGPLAGGESVAAPFVPSTDLADRSGAVRPELVWAALDCPSAFPLLEDESARRLEPMVLGRLAAELRAPLRAGRNHVVLAWPIGLEGRRGLAGCAIFDEQHRCVALARATWVSLARSALAK
jgi:hypothetical protein